MLQKKKRRKKIEEKENKKNKKWSFWGPKDSVESTGQRMVISDPILGGLIKAYLRPLPRSKIAPMPMLTNT